MTSEILPDGTAACKAMATAVIALLAERFPPAFHVYERRRRPLKLGIDQDIVARLDGAIAPDELSIALAFYCGNACYLAACVEGAARIDLDGNPAESVSAEQHTNASERLRARRTKAAQKAKSSKAKSTATKRDGLAELRAAARGRKEMNIT